MRLILLFVILFTSFSLKAQTYTRYFKGSVIDSASGKPIKDVSVCVYRAKDTSLINFGFTTPNGNFSLNAKSKDSLIIIVSAMGYEDKVKKYEMATNEWMFYSLEGLKLAPSMVTFSAVGVKKAAISMKGDTIEINASRFKVMPGSDVAQLFKKIPGFEVNVKGEIKVNGQKVTKILVDGSDFFGNNPGLVSKNLNADMIETVQVYEENKEQGGNEGEQTSVINLKLKKGAKNGLFGDVMAGYGNKNRYESGIRLNNFKNDRKVSFIINGNNINETGFDFGFDNWHNADDVNRNSGGSDDGSRYFYRNRNEGNINNKINGGLTYFNEFSKRRKLSVNLYSNNNFFNSISSSNNFTALNDSTNRTSQDSSYMDGKIHRLKFETSYTQQFDSTGYLSAGLELSGNETTNKTQSFNRLALNETNINDNFSDLNSLSKNQYINLKSSYQKNYKKNKFYSYNLGGNFILDQNQENTNQFTENTIDTFNNQYDRKTNLSEFLFKIGGSMPLYKKLVLNLNLDRWEQNNQANFDGFAANNRLQNTFEQTYENKIDSLSTDFNTKLIQHSVKPYLSYYKSGTYFNAGVTYLNLYINSQNTGSQLSKSYDVWMPHVSFSKYVNRKYNASVRFNKSINFPKVRQLMPVLNLNNNFERTTGNIGLKPEEVYSANLYTSFYKVKGFKLINLSARYSAFENAHINATKFNEEGILINSPENISGKRNFNYNINVSKELFKTLSSRIWVSQSISEQPFLINNIKGFNNRNQITIYPALTIADSDSLEISISASINYLKSKNSLNDFNNFSQITNSYDISLRTILRFGLEISTEFSLSDQRNIPNIGKVIPVWSAYLQQPIDKKGKYNLKLSAYDILNKNTSIMRTAMGNTISIYQENQLTQFFMLTLVYKIKKTGQEDEETFVW
jgi:hypothetical protein